MGATGSSSRSWPPIAERIRKARENAGLEEDDMASLLGMAQRSEYQDVELYDDEALYSTVPGFPKRRASS